MITAEYFRTKFEHEVRQTAERVRAELHLHSGAIFEIEAVREVEEGYVVLRAYPPNESESSAGRPRLVPAEAVGAPEVLDRLVVPYESIACLHFAPAAKHSGRTVGF